MILSSLLCLSSVAGLVSCNGQPTETQPDTSASSEPTEQNPDDSGKEEEEKRFSIKDLTPSDGKKLKIAFIGDSITQGTGVSSLSNQPTESYPGQLGSMLGFAKYQVGNFGKAAAYTLDYENKYNVKTDKSLSYRNTARYTESLAFGADVVVIMMGVNDMRSMTCDEAKTEFKKALASLAKEYSELPTVQKVYIATSIYIPNSAMAIQMSGGELQRLQCEVADELGLEVIDIYSMTREYMNVMLHTTSDRLHPNASMYTEMARAFKAALLGNDFEPTVPEKSESGVVYVKAGGYKGGKGATPEAAVESIALAVGLLRDGGGTIVICGPYSLTYNTHLPESKGLITVTTKYNGVDYAQTAGAKLGMAKTLTLYGDYKFENIAITSEASSIISCNYNNVTFGDGIVSTLNGYTAYPTLVAGYTLDSYAPLSRVSLYEGESNIIINSGKWAYIDGGNRRSQATYTMGEVGSNAKVNITINGGEFTLATGSNFTCAVGMNSFAGECNFTINGGKFSGNVYAIGRCGSNSTPNPAKMTGKINMTINGGEFSGKIYYKQDSTTIVSGTVNITIAAKYESVISGFGNVTKK